MQLGQHRPPEGPHYLAAAFPEESHPGPTLLVRAGTSSALDPAPLQASMALSVDHASGGHPSRGESATRTIPGAWYSMTARRPAEEPPAALALWRPSDGCSS